MNAAFAWGAPKALWFLLLMPVLVVAVGFALKSSRRRLEAWIAPGVWKTVIPDYSNRGGPRRLGLRAFAYAFGILALARPQWGTQEELLKITGLDVMLVLDVSTSMMVEDVMPSRLQKAKHLIRTFGERLKGDRLGLIAFAGSSFVASPVTTDTEYAVEMGQMMTPRMVTNQGTDIGLALETALLAMKRGGEAQDSKSEGKPVTTQAVVLITDGEDHEGGAQPIAKRIQEEGVKLYILGVGTQKGGPIPVRDDQGVLHGYKRDKSGQPVLSRFEADSLVALAQSASGRYWNVTDLETEVDELLQDLGGLNRQELAERKLIIRQERFQIPVAIAALLLLIEITLGLSKGSPKKSKKAKGHRDGTPTSTVGAAGLFLGFFVLQSLFSFQGELAYADRSWSSKQVPWGVYQSNREGLEALGAGKLDEARNAFGTAQAQSPELPELEFNRGYVEQKQENVDGAIQAFDRSSQKAGGLQDWALKGKSDFNSAYLRAKKGDFPGAVAGYSEALQSALKAKDVDLEKRIRKNLELLVEEEKKQQQQQKQNQDSGQGQENSAGDQKKDESNQNQKDSEDQKKNGSEKQEPKKGQEYKQKKQEFKSGKMTKDDAERVMNELSTREKELREKMKRKSGSPQSNEKDW